MSKRFLCFLLICCLLPLMSCSKAPEQTATGGAGGDSASTPPLSAAEPAKPIVLAENTAVVVRLIDAVSSASSHGGDSFMASLDEPLTVDGKVVFPKNTKVRGRVTKAVPSGRLKTPAVLAITLTEILPDKGKPVAIETTAVSEKAKSHEKRNAELIGGGAGVGALIGAIAGKGKGAAIGAAAGAGGGTAAAYATGKKDIGYASETRLSFRLRNDVTINR